MPNALNSEHQEKKSILPLNQKWQKCHVHIGDKRMACLRNKKVCFHRILAKVTLSGLPIVTPSICL